MDGYAGADASSLEDRIRRMILLNDSVPDEAGRDARPRVRLPPSATAYPQQPPSQHANGAYDHDQRHNIQMAGFVAPLPSPNPAHVPSTVVPPHLRPRAPAQQSPPMTPSQNHHQYTRAHPRGQAAHPRGNGQSRQQRAQHIQLDPDAFRRSGHGPIQGNAPLPAVRNSYDPHVRPGSQNFLGRDLFRQRQAQYLDDIVSRELPSVEMGELERSEKNAFRVALEAVCRDMCASNPNLPQVSLQCFGSFQSGFASAGSDMDLAIVVQDPSSAAACFSMMEEDLPRSLEMELLQKGIGARLLTRTRVPIIKVCENPGPDLLEKLFEEREKWAALPEEEKYPHLHKEDVTAENPAQQGIENAVGQAVPVSGAGPDQATAVNASKQIDAGNNGQAAQFRPKTWTRERKAGPLDFPKDGVGIQCDINFFNPLGLHNTQMLRCYAKCDPRVRPMVLFVKSWAKQRKINSSYSGTLSSYGYVMMVLHYLINIVQPPVLPNLQMPWRPRGIYAPPGSTKAEVDGWVVDFWANEDEIEAALRSGQMSSNADSLGSLLAGFFQYYSSMGYGPQFRWTQQVLSLRTPGGILSKDEKGWVKALTEEGDGRKIQHRYLFCIEDPFELSHNVARTVTHNGIVAIRDEFRRAQRILSLAGNGVPSKEGDLFDKLIEVEHPGPPHAQGEPTVPVERSSGPGLPSQQTHSQGPASPTVQQKEKPPSSTSPDGATSSAEAGQLGSAYQEAYPTLGTANSDSKRNKNINGPVKRANFNEISGDKAQAILEEFRRKKAEAQAESTAFGAAEAVLSGID